MKRTLLVIFWFMLPLIAAGADIDTGKWSVAFTDRNFGSLRTAVWGGGDRVWFKTDSGIGICHIKTSKAKYFGFDSLKITEKYGKIAAALGERAVYAGQGTQMILYDSIGWKSIVAPDSFSAIMMHDSGHIWAGNDSALYRYGTNGEWKKFPFKLQGPGNEASRIVEDDSGRVFYSDVNNRLYRLNGSVFNRITANKPSADLRPFLLFRDYYGKIWVYVTGSLWTVNQDQLVLDCEIDSSTNTFRSFNMDGGILTFAMGDKPENNKWFSAISGGPAFFCATGVVSYDQTGFKYYDDSKKENAYTYLSLRSMLANNGNGGITAETSDKFFYCKNDNALWITYNGNKNIVICKNGIYTELPPTGGVVNCVLEHSNGKMLVGTTIGLFFYNGLQWEPVVGMEGISVLSLIQDKTGKIWGISNGYMFRQNDFNWELIDNSNSDIIANIYKEIVGDNNGTIWVLTDMGVMNTKDGYHWTLSYSATVGIQSFMTQVMHLDSNGNVVLLLIPTSCNDSTSSGCITIKSTYKGDSWQSDTIKSPFSNSNITLGYMDMWGDIWNYRHTQSVPSDTLAGLYRYTGTQWIKYTKVNSPCSLAIVIGEIPRSKVFVVGFSPNSAKMTLYSFEHTTSTPVSSVLSSHQMKHAGVQLHVNSGKPFSIDLSLTKAGNVSMDLYSLSGRLVQTFVSGYRQKGSNRFICNVNSHKGVFFVRASTPDGISVNKVVIK